VTYLVAFILAFVVAALLTPLLRGLAPVIGGIDKARSSRKVHHNPVPRIGGIAIVAGFYAPLVGLFLYANGVSNLFLRDRWLVAGLFGGGLATAALGFFDDLYGVRARWKLLVQIGVALLLWFLSGEGDQRGFQIHTMAGIPLGPFAFPVTILWITGIINAMNLIDGLDGLAGGVAAIAVALNFAVAFSRPDVLMCLFMASLGGAVVGFLLYNFNPATIFMGDTGSMFLGFVLACSSVVTSEKSAATLSMLVPILGLGLPIADTLLAMIRRSLRGRPIFSADREHIHHRLLEMGFTHRQAVLTLYGVCLLLAAVAFSLTYQEGQYRVLLLSGVAIVAVFALRRLGYLEIDPVSARKNAEARARNQNIRGVVREIGEQLKDAHHVDVVWNSVKYLGPLLNAREMRMSIVVQEAAGEEVRAVHAWRNSEVPEHDTQAPCVVTLPLEGRPPVGANEARSLGDIVVKWTDGRRQIERDDEIALEIVKDHLETALERIAIRRPLEVALERTETSQPARRTGTDGAPAAVSDPGPTVIEFPRRADN
jgi:UDP-GlcNAc:undecaprenyl-phosphate GlcNAc-1-phosphate transferase